MSPQTDLAVPGLDEVRHAGKLGLARALAGIEAAPDAPTTLELLDAAFHAARAQVVGLTGPPGVGKSTLTSALIRRLRADGRKLGVVAVDPSSRRTGGALLGDRTRIEADPDDTGVFVRSLAARDQLGGLAALATATTVLMRALYDLVIVETVGVGQSETAIERLGDTVVLCIQPGSGDVLQFMKAGIAEIPDIVVVTKADLGALADKAVQDVRGALALAGGRHDGHDVPVLAVGAAEGRGIDELAEALRAHWSWLGSDARLRRRRHAHAEAWLVEAVREGWGRAGVARAAERDGLRLPTDESPFRRLRKLAALLA